MAPSIGKPRDRVDGRAKVTGGAKFSAEYPLDKIAYAYFTPASVAKGRIKTLDTKAAEAAPGVLAVVTHQNAPKLNPGKLFGADREGEPTAHPHNAPILQGGRNLLARSAGGGGGGRHLRAGEVRRRTGAGDL